MIAPLAGYGIKGAIWYQGENNADRARSYRELFPAMIRDWRALWGYDFPFFWVQLANFMAVEPQPGESAWAELREAQNRTLALPATGQAVITDVGEANDIHPRNKRDVGYRLSRAALNVAYGCTDIAAGGPIYRSMKRDGQSYRADVRRHRCPETDRRQSLRLSAWLYDCPVPTENSYGPKHMSETKKQLWFSATRYRNR